MEPAVSATNITLRTSARQACALALLTVALAGPSQAQIGSQRAESAVGRSYAASKTDGNGDLASIARLPGTVAAMPLQAKPANLKWMKGRTRVAVASWGLFVVRSGSVSSYAGGFGSSMMGRRSTIQTALIGVSDELAQSLASEAYDDLTARLKAAGFEVTPYAELQAKAGFAAVATGGAKVMTFGQPLYSPPDKPLKAGAPFFKATEVNAWSAIVDDGLVVLNPTMGVDYNELAGSGTHNYGSSASTSATVHFSVQKNAGAFVLLKPPPPYRGVWGAALGTDTPVGSDEAFAVMSPAGDKSDSALLANGMALAGLGSMYRQKNIYAVEVSPVRYAALVRSAFQGLNTSMVEQLLKATR